MNELILDHTEDDARLLIKAAFEMTPRVKKYTEQGQSITGETGLGLMSYGANIIVDISEHPTDSNKTPIRVRGEKKIPFNITNDHNKTKGRFIDTLNDLHGYPIEDVVDVMSKKMGVETNTDNATTDVKADGSDTATTRSDNGPELNNSYNSHQRSSTELTISSDRTRRWLKIALMLFVGWIALNILAAIIDFLVIV